MVKTHVSYSFDFVKGICDRLCRLLEKRYVSKSTPTYQRYTTSEETWRSSTGCIRSRTPGETLVHS